MAEQRVRVMVGEGQSARKGLLRFVLENEGHEVVAEVSSTLELAQQLVMHRPDIVVLDEGIDAGAVGMMREVLPSAKVILVWPRGVSAIGADARLEPSEVMTSLGATVARVIGQGPLMAPPRPRVPSQDVVVVPEAEAPTEAEVPVEPHAPEEAGNEPEGARPRWGTLAADVREAAGGPADAKEGDASEAAALTGVLMRPADLNAPRWTYSARGISPRRARQRRRQMWIAVAIVAALASIGLGAALLVTGGEVSIGNVTGNVGDFALPDGGGNGGPSVSTRPGIYNGIVRVRAEGLIRLRGTGDIRLRIDGLASVIAEGNLKVRGDGVVRNVSSSKIRVRGNGTIRITVKNGHVRMRIRGLLNARGEGTFRIGGDGRFMITRRPL